MTVSFDAPATVSEGQNFTVDLTINQVWALAYGEYFFSYDPTVIKLRTLPQYGVQGGEVDGKPINVDWWVFPPPSYEQGDVHVLLNTPGSTGISGSGYISRIYFKVVGSSGDETSLTFYDAYLLRENLEEIPVNWADYYSIQVVE